ncbi:MAG: hypothetical protein WCK69_03130, partial [Candidatus Saccharibacteria bacterium]
AYCTTKNKTLRLNLSVLFGGEGGIRSHSAPTFCRPDIDKLETSFKPVECPCNEPPAHLTRNFHTINK